MATNKNAQLRYKVLDRCFRNPGRKYFWQDLLDEVNKALTEFNGPASTIKRRQLFDDIKFMESEQGWSIPLKREKDGRRVYYRYADMEFSISNQPLNEQEINKIEAAVEALSRFSGAPQFEWIHELIPVLQDRLGLKDTGKEVISVQSNVDLRGIEYLSPLYEAIINEQVLEITYQDFKAEDPYSVIFHPYYLKQYNNRWFVLGLNEEKENSTWNLALDRIINIKQLPKKYVPTDIDWEEHFFDVIGVTPHADKEVETVRLAFANEVAPYVRTKPLHPTQRMLESEEGTRLVVKLRVIPNFELESRILSFGEQVEVLEPAHLREAVRKRLARAFMRYGG